MPMPSNAVSKSVLASVPLFYERRTASDEWGDLALNEQFSPFFDKTFYVQLEGCFISLFKDGFIERPSGIISAGAFVEKPGGHGKARAFDLDGFVWQGGRKWKATEYDTEEQRRFYCGLMCHFSMYFGNVLGWHYNNAHKDHIHIDDMVEIGFRHNSRAVVTTIQSALKYIYLLDIEVDGSWGRKTRDAMAKIVFFPDIYPNANVYLAFLDFARSKAFMTVPKRVEDIIHPSLKELPDVTKFDERLTHIEDFLASYTPRFRPKR